MFNEKLEASQVEDTVGCGGCPERTSGCWRGRIADGPGGTLAN